MQTIKGIIERFTYHNEENGYSVARLENDITAVGILPGIKVGQTVVLNGEWVNHPSYGKQFKINSFSAAYPATATGIIKYLGSGLVKGIGPVMAERIVNVFKENTLDIIESHPERLKEIDGIGSKRVDMIVSGWKEQKSIKELMLFLQSHEVSTTLAIKIYKTYKEQAFQIVKEDPYQLTYDIWGVGFKTADKIGRNMGFDETHPGRIRAGIIFVLNEAVNEGHIYLPKDKLIEECSRILDLTFESEAEIISEMHQSGHLLIEDENVYLPPFYYAELGIAAHIKQMLASNDARSAEEQDLFYPDLVSYSDEQRKAISEAAVNHVFILTGGPGTGKTTTLKGMIQLFKSKKKRILLAAPTGRAAKRMSEVIGIEAQTIHRLLEYDPMTRRFKKNEDDQLDTDVIVIDEVSMIDTILMNSLLKAVKASSRIIFVGDVNQLPSIGAGNVLNDMINSGIIPYVKLTKIFRQAEKSKIITNSHKINSGIFPDLANEASSDFFFMEENDQEKIPSIILELVMKRLPSKYNLDPRKDIQILTPMYRGESGANNLNKILQERLNPAQILFSRGGKNFKPGDKVMQIKNNYDKEVFNGDSGIIAGVDQENQNIMVDFGLGRPVCYDFADADELVLAYAATVHKSQGSEYPCVILPLTVNHYMMLQRNLLYTAITRAKQLMIIIGSKKALAIAINNSKVNLRYTSLFREKSAAPYKS